MLSVRQIQVLLFGTFWGFLPEYFQSVLVVSVDVKPVDTEADCAYLTTRWGGNELMYVKSLGSHLDITALLVTC